MGALKSSKSKDHALIVQGSKNAISKVKQIVKEKKTESDNTSTKWGISYYVTKNSSHHRFLKWFTTKYEQFWLAQQ